MGVAWLWIMYKRNRTATRADVQMGPYPDGPLPQLQLYATLCDQPRPHLLLV